MKRTFDDKYHAVISFYSDPKYYVTYAPDINFLQVYGYFAGEPLGLETRDTSNWFHNTGTILGANFAYLDGFAAVPVPSAVWLFGSGLLGLIGMARRKKV